MNYRIDFKIGGANFLLNIIRVIFAVIAFCLAAYSLITNKYQVMPYMLFFLGAMMLFTGISELKVKRKTNATISLAASAFVLFVSIYTRSLLS